MSVPLPHEETVKVKLLPDEALIEKVQPVAVPALEKSALATEFTFCEKVIAKSIAELVLVGVVCAVVNDVGTGALR
jgi:hypothetical protein